ncbi:MAG TPA: hypothetical protein DDW74_05200, partial [Porphyromonadaceae bacterium]|nr:hypothetical protein [Porphyromonadaceae bacterium]
GKKLIPDEQIPAGSPLKLVVGSGMSEDSLSINREIVVSPGVTGTIPDSSRNVPVKPSNMDESFF